jgi:hypothetical protein
MDTPTKVMKIAACSPCGRRSKIDRREQRKNRKQMVQRPVMVLISFRRSTKTK